MERRHQGRRATDVTTEELGKLAALAGARVDALQDVGNDIAALTAAVEGLAASIETMATKEEVEAVNKAQDEKRQRTVLVGSVVGIVAFILLASPSILLLFALDRLQTVADDNQANGRVLVECTTPTPKEGEALDEEDRVHECFERNSAQTSEAVGNLTFATLDAAVCARTVEDPAALQSCFMDRQTARSQGRTPNP